jgi:hypothetical protein
MLMTPEEKEILKDALNHERELTDEKFRSRDQAITLLAGQRAVYLALGIAILGLIPWLFKFFAR